MAFFYSKCLSVLFIFVSLFVIYLLQNNKDSLPGAKILTILVIIIFAVIIDMMITQDARYLIENFDILKAELNRIFK